MPLPRAGDSTSFEAVIKHARGRRWPAELVAELASHLAASGERLNFDDAVVADVASTGGPGSLSTLLAPLTLRAKGAIVVKLAVPGRPAGAIDALGTLPNYRVSSSTQQVHDTVRACGYAHFLADERFAPLDAELFSYRRKVDAVALPNLAAASLLAKKIAVGVRVVGLDVRVGAHGNFGTLRAEARENALMFCQAAAYLGLEATAFLSDAPAPAQPFVGRGESLVALGLALGLLPGELHPSLAAHIRHCTLMAEQTLAHSPLAGSQPANRLQMLAALDEHLVGQGSSRIELEQRMAETCSATRTILASVKSGVLRIDVAAVRDAIVSAQDDLGTRFSDPVGIVLSAAPGQYVLRDTPIAAVRITKGNDVQSLRETLAVRFHEALAVDDSLSEDAPISSDGSDVEVIRA